MRQAAGSGYAGSIPVAETAVTRTRSKTPAGHSMSWNKSTAEVY